SHAPGAGALRAKALLVELGDVPRRCTAGGVEPREQEAIDDARRPHAAAQGPRDNAGIGRGERAAAAVDLEPEPVERAEALLALHGPAAEVRAEMRARGVDHGQRAALGSKDDHVATEALERGHRTAWERRGLAESEPTGRVRRKREAIRAAGRGRVRD